MKCVLPLLLILSGWPEPAPTQSILEFPGGHWILPANKLVLTATTRRVEDNLEVTILLDNESKESPLIPQFQPGNWNLEFRSQIVNTWQVIHPKGMNARPTPPWEVYKPSLLMHGQIVGTRIRYVGFFKELTEPTQVRATFKLQKDGDPNPSDVASDWQNVDSRSSPGTAQPFDQSPYASFLEFPKRRWSLPEHKLVLSANPIRVADDLEIDMFVENQKRRTVRLPCFGFGRWLPLFRSQKDGEWKKVYPRFGSAPLEYPITPDPILLGTGQFVGSRIRYVGYFKEFPEPTQLQVVFSSLEGDKGVDKVDEATEWIDLK